MFQEDYDWQDERFDQVLEILNKNKKGIKAQQSDVYRDQKHCSDAVIKMKDENKIYDVSVRMRKNKYKKHDDMTIRSTRATGSKTELEKLLNGEGDYYFYCWLNEDETEIEKYWIVRINDDFRNLLRVERREIENYDDSTFFVFIKEYELRMYNLIKEEGGK